MPHLAALVLFAAVIGHNAAGATTSNDQGTQNPWGNVNDDVPPADARSLPPSELVIVAEKVPFELPNGQILVLLDHKVGRNRIRYEVDGTEYKPGVGTTVAFPGPNYAVLVTCTQWKLLKKHYGRDSAEFQIECIGEPAQGVPAAVAPGAPTAVPPPMWSELDTAAPPAPSASAVQPPGPKDARPLDRTQAPVEPRALPAPFSVILAENRPFCLPNGQFLILKDHKVSDCQVRYEVDGIEYKPAVGDTLTFPGQRFSVHVTCSRWKLLKKYYGEDSAEFVIELSPAP